MGKLMFIGEKILTVSHYERVAFEKAPQNFPGIGTAKVCVILRQTNAKAFVWQHVSVSERMRAFYSQTGSCAIAFSHARRLQNDFANAPTWKFWEVLEPSSKKVLTSLVWRVNCLFSSPINQNLMCSLHRKDPQRNLRGSWKIRFNYLKYSTPSKYSIRA